MRRIVFALSAVLLALSAPAAVAALPEQGLVSDDPVDWTPHVLDGEVRAITTVGDTVVVGGDFTAVTETSGAKFQERWYLFAFSLSTGKILESFDPWLDGSVMSLEAGPDNTVYVGGRFRKAGDRDQRGITQLDLSTGKPVAEFTAALDWGDVRAIASSNGSLYIGGTFPAVNGVPVKGLAKLDPRTGAPDAGFDAGLEGPELDRVRVEDLAVSPQGDRLLAIGAFTQAGGDYRVQAAMFDLTGREPVLAPWWTDAFNKSCRKGFDTYLRAVDFSPAGDYLVIVTTGRMNAEQKLCDSAARFETYRDGEVKATWVNHTGGDSLYAVEISDSAVYVGGHQRWMDNPHGHESAGPGAVDRPGLAAIDPDSGRATEWNPTRSRGVGVRAFAMTSRGLLAGSDTDELAREYHGRIGLFPN
jgi:hypothetical protein